MNTQHLKYAIEVAQTGSITQAADNLYIGQPSLSKAIKELEESLGITIFARTSKGAVPTEKGEEFLKYARAVMSQIDKMEALYRPRNPDRHALSVSIPRSTYVSTAVASFVGELGAGQGVDVDVCETNSMQVINNVAQGRSSLGVVRYQMKNEQYFMDYIASKDLRFESIWEFDPLVVFSKKHPLSARLPLRAEALFPYTEVILGDETIPYISTREDARPDVRDDKRICVYDRINLFEMVLRVPGAYLWSAPLTDDLLNRYAVVQRYCPLPDGKRRDGLVYMNGHEFSGTEKRFVNKLFEDKNKLALQVYL